MEPQFCLGGAHRAGICLFCMRRPVLLCAPPLGRFLSRLGGASWLMFSVAFFVVGAHLLLPPCT
eukprot:1036480-Alexandrium_andersonii.AAC.1